MLFTIICTDKPGSTDVRAATRPQHLAYVQATIDRIREAGPLLDGDDRPCGSLLLVDMADREAADSFAAGDRDARAGLFESTVIRPIRQVARDGKLFRDGAVAG